MRAVRLHGVGNLRVETIDAPPPPTGDYVVLRVTAAGICGSDLHNFRTGQWVTRVPSVPGHEVAGLVEAVGPDVARLRPGDAVVADSRAWCGTCGPCCDGRRHLCEAIGFVGEVCDGGFAERMAVPERLLHRVDPGLDSRVPGSTARMPLLRQAHDRDRELRGCCTSPGSTSTPIEIRMMALVTRHEPFQDRVEAAWLRLLNRVVPRQAADAPSASETATSPGWREGSTSIGAFTEPPHDPAGWKISRPSLSLPSRRSEASAKSP